MSINIKLFLPKGLIGWLGGQHNELFFQIGTKLVKCSATSWLEILIEMLFFWSILARAFFFPASLYGHHMGWPSKRVFSFCLFACYRVPGWYATTINAFPTYAYPGLGTQDYFHVCFQIQELVQVLLHLLFIVVQLYQLYIVYTALGQTKLFLEVWSVLVDLNSSGNLLVF